MAISFEELKQAEKRLEQQDSLQNHQQSMSLEDFRKLLATMDDVKNNTKDTQRSVKEGLIETEGTGLNSNIVRLTDELKRQTNVSVKNVENATPQRVIDEKLANQLEDRSKEKVDKYIPGTADYFKEKVSFELPTIDFKQLKQQWSESLKSAFSLESLLDMSEGRNTGGLLGGQLRRVVEKNKFIKQQMEADPTIDRKQASERYHDSLKTRSKIVANEKKIERLKARGTSEQEIDKLGLIETRKNLDKQLRQYDVIYNKQREQDELGVLAAKTVKPKQQKNINDTFASSLNTSTTTTPLMNTLSGLVGSEEQQNETLRLVIEQTDLLRKIETNTRNLDKLGKPNLIESIGQAVPSNDRSSLLGDIVTGGVIGTILNKGGRGMGKIAGGARGLLGKTAGFARKNVAKLNVVGALAAGAYDTYQGWSQANEQQQAGLITEDQAEIQKTAAVGKGVGGAGGLIGGSLAGAAIGSVVPVLGTTIGGLIGGALGYFGGSKAGSNLGEFNAKTFKKVTSLIGDSDSDVELPTKVDDNSYETANMSTLGSLLADKGTKTDKFVGNTSFEFVDPQGNVSTKTSNILGERTSTGLLSSGEYEVSSGDIKVKVDKNTYQQLESLTKQGKTDEAVKRIEEIYAAQRSTQTTPLTAAPQGAFGVIGNAIRSLFVAPTSADNLYQKSGENAASATQNTVVSAPTTVIAPTTNNQQTQNFTQKGGPRNSESSYQSYTKSRFSY